MSVSGIEKNPNYELESFDYLQIYSVCCSVLQKALEVVETCETKHYKCNFLEHNWLEYNCKHNLTARLGVTLQRKHVIKTSRLKFKEMLGEL